ncbi:hypothetical protein, partial [Nocardia gipuzkoensis]|uniref:hypothetical protein n=1 Tax=Nocardia gipuzkoensis TaxID=2749991 RepID=UPI002456EF84
AHPPHNRLVDRRQPRYIAQDAAAAIDTLSSSVQAHLAQEFGDIRRLPGGGAFKGVSGADPSVEPVGR